LLPSEQERRRGRHQTPQRIAAAILALVVAALAVTAVPARRATALSTDVVISAVYGGGGNAGATIRNDFIELANLTGNPVDVSGWSVQYASTAGTVFQMTALSGSIPANGRYLVQQAAGPSGSLVLPTPDATGSIPMSATSGVVALVTAQIPLVGCGISCATAPNVKDLVGYGATAKRRDARRSGPVQHHRGRPRRRHGRHRQQLRRLHLRGTEGDQHRRDDRHRHRRRLG
jgi:hypothetical protein